MEREPSVETLGYYRLSLRDRRSEQIIDFAKGIEVKDATGTGCS